MVLIKPQQIVRPAPYGSLLKPHVIIRPPRPIESDGCKSHLENVRHCPCLKCGMDPCGEATHVRITSAAFNKRGGIGARPADKWALPLDSGCHTRDRDALHRQGEYLFWQALGLNPLLICERLWAKRGDLIAMRAVVFCAIAERG